MANDFEYLEDHQQPWLTGAQEGPEEDVHSLLNEWGIGRYTATHAVRHSPHSLQKYLEEWFIRAHVEKNVELPPCTGAELRFNRLKKEWIKRTEKLSNLAQIILDPAYQQIIAMGKEALPLILRSLEAETDHWFWALKIINDNEDVAEGAETLATATAAWLRWGREKGYLDS